VKIRTRPTIAAKAIMFQRPRLQSALRRLPSAVLRAASASQIGSGRVQRAENTDPSLSAASTRSAGVAPAGALEVADLGKEAWWASFGQHSVAPAVEPDDTSPSQRAPSLTTDLRRPGTPPQALPPAEALLLAAPRFVAELVRTWHDCLRPCMIAGYDDGNALLIDFARREVRADTRAWERLLARGELPRMCDESFEVNGPSHVAKVHPIESLIWAIGLASADLPLFGAPAAWRSARLSSRGWQDFLHLSCAPAHLHLAELASQGETTPEQLRRATRVDERGLRAFLQAALFLRLLEWSH
jgi:hypothetical protein